MAKKKKKSKKGRKASHKPRKSTRRKTSRKKGGKRKSHKGKRRNLGRVSVSQVSHAPTDVLESELKDAEMMAKATSGSDAKGFARLARKIRAELNRRKRGPKIGPVSGVGRFAWESKKRKKKAKAASKKKGKSKKKKASKKKSKKSGGMTKAQLVAALRACRVGGRTSTKGRGGRKRSTKATKLMAARSRSASRRKACKTGAKRKPVACQVRPSKKALAGCGTAAGKYGVSPKKLCGPGAKSVKRSARGLAKVRYGGIHSRKFWGD